MTLKIYNIQSIVVQSYRNTLLFVMHYEYVIINELSTFLMLLQLEYK